MMTTKAAFKRTNTRRHELIDLKYSVGLTAEEEAEYEAVTAEVDEYIGRVYDQPLLDHLEGMLAAARAAATTPAPAGRERTEQP